MIPFNKTGAASRSWGVPIGYRDIPRLWVNTRN